MNELTKISTREHSLMFFKVWNDADRKDYKQNWFDTDIANLFIGEGKTGRTSVWYLTHDLETITKNVETALKADPIFFEKSMLTYNLEWEYIKYYLFGSKVINSISEMEELYYHYVRWWSVMSIVHDIKLSHLATDEIVKIVEKARAESERYSEEMDKLFMSFLKKRFSHLSHIHNVLLPTEVFSLDKQDLSKNEIETIEKRLDGYIIYNDSIFLKDELSTILNKNNLYFEIIENEVQNLSHIEGRIACAGIAKGKARIIKYKKEIAEFQEGEILVTEMTTPDYILAISKAAAVVTDEGGITCHAAIICRELNIPCVIGTQFATTIFKNGDMLEVDADKGVVTKI